MRIYVPCSECGEPVENDMNFFRPHHAGGSEQYGLCGKHLPKTPRVWAWMNSVRIGRRWATFLGLGRGYGGCGRCGTPWDCIRHHTTNYSDGSGCFALCEPCWQQLTPTERLPYYDALVDRWAQDGNEQNGMSLTEIRRRIRHAVLEEVGAA